MLFQHRNRYFLTMSKIYKCFIQCRRKTCNHFSFCHRKASKAPNAIAHCHLGKPISPQPWRKNCGSTFFTQHIYIYVKHHTRTHIAPEPQQQLCFFSEVPFRVFHHYPSLPSLSLCLSVALPIRIHHSNSLFQLVAETGFSSFALQVTYD